MNIGRIVVNSGHPQDDAVGRARELDQALELLENRHTALHDQYRASARSALADVLDEGAMRTLKEDELAQFLEGTETGLRTQLFISGALSRGMEQLEAEEAKGKQS